MLEKICKYLEAASRKRWLERDLLLAWACGIINTRAGSGRDPNRRAGMRARGNFCEGKLINTLLLVATMTRGQRARDGYRESHARRPSGDLNFAETLVTVQQLRFFLWALARLSQPRGNGEDNLYTFSFFSLRSGELQF